VITDSINHMLNTQNKRTLKRGKSDLDDHKARFLFFIYIYVQRKKCFHFVDVSWTFFKLQNIFFINVTAKVNLKILKK